MKLDIIMWQESGYIFVARYTNKNLLIKKATKRLEYSQKIIKKSNVSLKEWAEFKERVLKWKKKLDVQDVAKK